MQLNFKKTGTGPSLIILHGLFGMLDNWLTVAKQLENDFTLYLIDQRNHGKSPHTSEHTYAVMAQDLLEFMEQQQLSTSYLLGHSMGGKTAMQFAINYPEQVNKLIVVDMGIRRYPGGHDDLFDALFSVDLSKVHYRADAENVLLEKIPDFGTRQFVLKNLSRNPDGSYSWKFNLQALFDQYQSGILAPVTGGRSFQGKTLFIRGEHSDYIKDADWDSILQLFPKATLTTIAGAGHWVHADKPAQLTETVRKFLIE